MQLSICLIVYQSVACQSVKAAQLLQHRYDRYVDDARIFLEEQLLQSGGPLCEFRRVDGRYLTRSDFRTNLRGSPAIISRALSVGSTWSRESFLARYGARRVSVNNGRFDRARSDATASVADMFSLEHSRRQLATDYKVFAADDIGRSLGAKVCLDVHRELEPALPAFLVEFNARRILSIGSLAAETKMHAHDETWLGLLSGAKAWWLRPPQKGHSSFDEEFNPCMLPSNKTTALQLASDLSFCLQLPGEIVYFGDQQPHATCNLQAFTLGVGAQGHTEAWPQLIRAAHNGDLSSAHDAMNFLGKRDIDEYVILNGERQSGLHRAIQIGSRDLVEYLDMKGATESQVGSMQPMDIAAQFGHAPVVELLASKKANVASADKQGSQPIHIASLNGHVAVIRMLVNLQANTEAADGEGWHPMHVASREGHTTVVEFLSHLRASLSAVDKQGSQPTHVASLNGHGAVLALLLSQGASISAVENQGWQPMHVAASSGHLGITRLLFSQRASLVSADNQGFQPLHIAALDGHVAVIEMLASEGADVGAEDGEGWQAMHAAALRGHSGIVQLLISERASIKASDHQGTQPMHVAISEGHDAVVKLLVSWGAKATIRHEV